MENQMDKKMNTGSMWGFISDTWRLTGLSKSDLVTGAMEVASLGSGRYT